MDILVLIMLALFLIIIALAVVIYVIVRRNSIDKKFDKTIDSDLNNLDDDDDDDFSNINIVMPSSFKETKTEDIKEEKENDIKNNDNVNKEENQKVENELDKEEKETTNVDVVIEPVIVEEKKVEKIEELINVLINKKNYIFLANNNVVSKNDYIKLILDSKVYFGVVTKANYRKDISQFKVKPRKLIIIKKNVQNEQEKKGEKKIVREEIIEFVPKKKEKI